MGWIAEILGRSPIRIDGYTDETALTEEMTERLDALLQSNNCDASPEGWRDLAIALALKHEPAFKIETPVDRTGQSGAGGRPVDWKPWIMRQMMRQATKKFGSRKEAGKRLARKHSPSAKTFENMLSREQPLPDDMRRWDFEWKADRAIRKAAQHLSQK